MTDSLILTKINHMFNPINPKSHSKWYFWYLGIAFFVIVNFIAGGVAFFVDVKGTYSTLKLPWFAPPVWVFGVAWTTNNILTIIGNIWTINLPSSTNRTRLLWLQGCSWVNYCLFQYLSFGTRIISLYFWPAFSMLVLNVLSLYYAYILDTVDMSFLSKVKSGKSITMSLFSLISWLVIASLLGLSIWIMN